MRLLTDEQIEFITNLKLKQKLTWRQIAEEFNARFHQNVTPIVIRFRWTRAIKNPTVNNSVSPSNSPQISKPQNILDYIESKIKKLKFKPITVPRWHGKPSDLQYHVLRSDAQVGELVDPNSTSGLGAYNFEIYLKRLERLLHKVILFYDQDHKALGLSKLVSPQLGDQVEGEGSVYPGQSYYIDLPLVDQLFGSLEAEINKFWLPLAKIFPEIELFCVTGNHGRGGKKGEHHERTNWDYVYYKTLKLLLTPLAPNVKIYISESPSMLVQHGDFLFNYSHGDIVPYYMGLPFYGLDRMARRLNNMFNMYINYFCVGHFHSPASLNDNIFVNGTMVGGSHLSINKMNLNSVPSQKIFYLDKKKGVNRETNLYLEDPIILVPDKNGVLTPYT